MKHIWFYPRLIGILLIILLVAYALIASGRFLYFRHAGLQLLNLSRKDEYTIGSGKPLTQVAVFGDSSAYGIGASDYTQTYHYQFLQKQPGTFRVHNYGEVGLRVGEVAQHLQQIKHVDLLFISIGGNDVTHLTRFSELSNQLDKMLALAESKADTVILITPGSMGDVGLLPWPIRAFLGYRSAQVSSLTKIVAAKHNVIQVDMFSHIEYSFNQNPKTNFAADLFHPSNAGYALWAAAITKDVERVGGLHL